MKKNIYIVSDEVVTYSDMNDLINSLNKDEGREDFHSIANYSEKKERYIKKGMIFICKQAPEHANKKRIFTYLNGVLIPHVEKEAAQDFLNTPPSKLSDYFFGLAENEIAKLKQSDDVKKFQMSMSAIISYLQSGHANKIQGT